MPKGIKGFQKGHKSFWTEESKKKKSETQKLLGIKPPTLRGENHPMWRGGIADTGRYVERRSSVPGERKTLHRIVMENKMGRPLKRREVVHHWDENGKNNEETNLQFFRHNTAHLRLHHFANRNGLEIETLKFSQDWLFTP